MIRISYEVENPWSEQDGVKEEGAKGELRSSWLSTDTQPPLSLFEKILSLALDSRCRS